MNTKSVLVAFPNMGTLHIGCVKALLVMHNDPRGCELGVTFKEAQPIENCRNQLVQHFLTETDFEYLMMMDDDNPPGFVEGRNPLDLVELDKDIMVLPTPMYAQMNNGKHRVVWNAFYDKENAREYHQLPYENQIGLQRIDSGGSGCILIARRVLEKIVPAFVRLFDDKGIVTVGSDLNFCDRARAEGFEIWTNFDYPCMHIKPTDLLHFLVREHALMATVRNKVVDTKGFLKADEVKHGVQNCSTVVV